jgi:U3 small nucleolar RNA-associated protein 18
LSVEDRDLETQVFGLGLDLQPQDSADPLPEASPAWQDEDDVKMETDLTAQNRLKKLRKNEDEVVIAGDELSARLRENFETLHETPAWAKIAHEEKESQLTRLMRSNLKVISTDPHTLLPDDIRITRVRDANASRSSDVGFVFLGVFSRLLVRNPSNGVPS